MTWKDWLVFGFWALALPTLYFVTKFLQDFFADPPPKDEAEAAKRKADEKEANKAAVMNAMTSNKD